MHSIKAQQLEKIYKMALDFEQTSHNSVCAACVSCSGVPPNLFDLPRRRPRYAIPDKKTYRKCIPLSMCAPRLTTCQQAKQKQKTSWMQFRPDRADPCCRVWYPNFPLILSRRTLFPANNPASTSLPPKSLLVLVRTNSEVTTKQCIENFSKAHSFLSKWTVKKKPLKKNTPTDTLYSKI